MVILELLPILVAPHQENDDLIDCINFLIPMKRGILLISSIVLIIILQHLSGCKKSAPVIPDNPFGLPNATQTGEGSFSFHMNGSNYFVKNNIYDFDAGVLHDTLAIKAYFDYGSYYGGFYIGTVANASVNTTYDLSDTIHTYCYFVTDSTCQVLVRETSVKAKKGSITLTKIDSTNKIVSGIFNINFRVPGCDSMIVSAGRFDCTIRFR